MVKTSTSWRPGQSGNPNGRPRRNRTLADALRRAGSKTIERNGKRVSGRRLVAALLWEAAGRGKVVFDDHVLTASWGDWLEVVEFIFTRADGPVMQEIDVTSGGERIGITDSELARELAVIFAAARARATQDAGGDSEVPLDAESAS